MRDDFIEITVSRFENAEPRGGLIIIPYSMPAHNFALVARSLAAYASARLEGMEPYTIHFLKQHPGQA